MEKIIHQIWIGPYNIPEKERVFADNIKSAHPDFTYIFWDHIPQLPYELQRLVDLYTSLKHWVHIADLLRYYLVNEHGGIYIDCDYQLLSPISNLRLEEHEGFDLLTTLNSVYRVEPMFDALPGVQEKHSIKIEEDEQ